MPVPKPLQGIVGFVATVAIVGAWIGAWVAISSNPNAFIYGASGLVAFALALLLVFGEAFVS